MVKDLEGKTALVTGGDRGIGRAIGIALARAGCAIALTYREREDAARATLEAIRACGARGEALRCDLADRSALQALVADVEARLGAIDVLINNAGIAARREVDAITEDDWDRHLAVNLTAPFVLTQAVLPGMRARRWGRIVNLGSVAAQNGGVIGPHYAATKGGLTGLTHGYAVRLAKEGITVNAIAPALIETEMVSGQQPTMIPMGRFGTVEEVADACVLLVRNGYMTGQTISVNGGAYMTS
ncbi:MAG TPA: SDR family NAD(P)-dependent oxidoreductase [Candidatus Limnocylindria bacterium]|jgi:3-oxoacyl-[acyl-carrier protein] reductase|nr:SDR family NAD(P)-dependent oxidoreductase [Candidatus Limnocylindria bacterium]